MVFRKCYGRGIPISYKGIKYSDPIYHNDRNGSLCNRLQNNSSTNFFGTGSFLYGPKRMTKVLLWIYGLFMYRCKGFSGGSFRRVGPFPPYGTSYAYIRTWMIRRKLLVLLFFPELVSTGFIGMHSSSRRHIFDRNESEMILFRRLVGHLCTLGSVLVDSSRMSSIESPLDVWIFVTLSICVVCENLN